MPASRHAAGPGLVGPASCASGVCDTTGSSAPGTCEPANTCGNGEVETGEGCDDGKPAAAGDGCDEGCKVEDGTPCGASTNGLQGASSCASGVCDTKGNAAPGVCEPANVHGNGVVEMGANETCDDGNVAAGDGCDQFGADEICGDGRVNANEDCDDKDKVGGDGCSATCTIEPGYTCVNAVNINTGSNGHGGQAPIDTPDPVWQYAETMGGALKEATVSDNCAPGFWTDPPANARWITRHGCDTSTPQEVDTYYTATFEIPSATAPANTVLQGTVWADNYITAVLVNGNVTGFTGTGFDGAGLSFGAWPSTYYKQGTNEITIVVHNGTGNGLNPDGLLVSVPGVENGSVCTN